jgi:glycosyltransferase involved in cell wall biosynthesis
MDISIIIPAYNEEKYLESTLNSVSQYIPAEYNFEVIIVDNNSTDKTVDIAKRHTAIVIEKQTGSVAALRNIGARRANGKILVFLDADVSLTELWSDNFPHTFDKLLAEKNIVTGSTVGISTENNLIEKYWFKPWLEKPLSFINTGHLIVNHELYSAVGGFDESLVTGEDYDFSMRCKSLGATIIDDQSLYVRHAGYPKTIGVFFLREAWHGMGDFQSLANFFSSYVAILAVIIFFSSAYLLFDLLILHDFLSGVFSLLLIFFICMSVTIKKYGLKSLSILSINSFLYYIYFTARAYSLVKVLFSKNIKRTRK